MHVAGAVIVGMKTSVLLQGQVAHVHAFVGVSFMWHSTSKHGRVCSQTFVCVNRSIAESFAQFPSSKSKHCRSQPCGACRNYISSSSCPALHVEPQSLPSWTHMDTSSGFCSVSWPARPGGSAKEPAHNCKFRPRHSRRHRPAALFRLCGPRKLHF